MPCLTAVDSPTRTAIFLPLSPTVRSYSTCLFLLFFGVASVLFSRPKTAPPLLNHNVCYHTHDRCPASSCFESQAGHTEMQQPSHVDEAWMQALARPSFNLAPAAGEDAGATTWAPSNLGLKSAATAAAKMPPRAVFRTFFETAGNDCRERKEEGGTAQTMVTR